MHCAVIESEGKSPYTHKSSITPKYRETSSICNAHHMLLNPKICNLYNHNTSKDIKPTISNRKH